MNQTASQIVATRGLLPRKVKLWRSPSVVPGAAAFLSLFDEEGAGSESEELEGREARKGGAQLSLCPTFADFYFVLFFEKRRRNVKREREREARKKKRMKLKTKRKKKKKKNSKNEKNDNSRATTRMSVSTSPSFYSTTPLSENAETLSVVTRSSPDFCRKNHPSQHCPRKSCGPVPSSGGARRSMPAAL